MGSHKELRAYALDKMRDGAFLLDLIDKLEVKIELDNSEYNEYVYKAMMQYREDYFKARNQIMSDKEKTLWLTLIDNA